MLTRNNNVEALRLLLEDVNAQSGEYGSALQAVVGHGSIEAM